MGLRRASNLVLAWLVTLVVALASFGTTESLGVVRADAFTYDAFDLGRVEVTVTTAGSALSQVGDPSCRLDLRSSAVRGAFTTPIPSVVATNTGGGGAEPPPDNSDMHINDVLDAASAFLGAGYSEIPPGSGRFVSADGTRVVRMKDSDITGRHGRGPHANFETLECDPKTGRMRVVDNRHVYFKD